jgi:hypothetical protein
VLTGERMANRCGAIRCLLRQRRRRRLCQKRRIAFKKVGNPAQLLTALGGRQMTPNRFLCVDEVAQRLRCSMRSVHEMTRLKRDSTPKAARPTTLPVPTRRASGVGERRSLDVIRVTCPTARRRAASQGFEGGERLRAPRPPRFCGTALLLRGALPEQIAHGLQRAQERRGRRASRPRPTAGRVLPLVEFVCLRARHPPVDPIPPFLKYSESFVT